LLDFAIIARISKGGLATIAEIEEKWTFEMMQKGLAYLDMDTAIENAINKICLPKDK
jgi:hypothetical protein